MEVVCTVKGLHMMLVCHFMEGRGLQLWASHLHPGRRLEANPSHLPQLVHLTTINCNKTEQNKSQTPKWVHSFCHLARGVGVVVWLHSPQRVLLGVLQAGTPAVAFISVLLSGKERYRGSGSTEQGKQTQIMHPGDYACLRRNDI